MNQINSDDEEKNVEEIEHEFEERKFIEENTENKDKNEMKSEHLIAKFEFIEKKLNKTITFEKSGDFKTLSVRFDPLDNFIASACEDGHVRIYQKDKQNCLINLFEDLPNMTPATCVRWKPFNQNTKNILITGHTDGSLNHWHATSKKLIHTLVEPNNHIYCMDFKNDGKNFVTGGRDGEIRYYDEAKISKFQILKEGNAPTHKNRIYAVKFLQDNPHLILSGGWDKVVLLWDMRTGSSENYLYGPMICGDALDYSNGLILTGSWRDEDQLELWDMKMMKKLQIIKWQEFEDNLINDKKSFVYACQFQKGKGHRIIAGSTGNNEIRVFDVNKNFECVDGLRDFEQGIFSLDWCNNENDNIFAFAGGSGLCGLISI